MNVYVLAIRYACLITAMMACSCVFEDRQHQNLDPQKLLGVPLPHKVESLGDIINLKLIKINDSNSNNHVSLFYKKESNMIWLDRYESPREALREFKACVKILKNGQYRKDMDMSMSRLIGDDNLYILFYRKRVTRQTEFGPYAHESAYTSEINILKSNIMIIIRETSEDPKALQEIVDFLASEIEKKVIKK
jgi:hypothetical protein